MIIMWIQQAVSPVSWAWGWRQSREVESLFVKWPTLIAKAPPVNLRLATTSVILKLTAVTSIYLTHTFALLTSIQSSSFPNLIIATNQYNLIFRHGPSHHARDLFAQPVGAGLRGELGEDIGEHSAGEGGGSEFEDWAWVGNYGLWVSYIYLCLVPCENSSVLSIFNLDNRIYFHLCFQTWFSMSGARTMEKGCCGFQESIER